MCAKKKNLLEKKVRDNHTSNNFSIEELDFFEERKNIFFQNGKEGSSVEEAHNQIRDNYKKRTSKIE